MGAKHVRYGWKAEGRLISLVHGSADHQDGLLNCIAQRSLTKGLSNNERVRGQPQHFSTVFGYEDNWNGSRGANCANRVHATSLSDPLVGRYEVGAALLGSPDCVLLPIDNVERSVSERSQHILDDGSFQEHVLDDQCVHRLLPK
jgi:hypothetical protein